MGTQQTQRFSFLVKIGDADPTQKLIPLDLSKHFNGVVPDEAILKTCSTGRCWIVKIKRLEKDFAFGKGWSEFVEYHSLESGDSLALKYKGKSQFYFKIYGRNGGEKELVSSCNNMAKPINPAKKKEKEPAKSEEKLKECDVDFDYLRYCERFGPDSIGFDSAEKNKKKCESSKCVEPSMQKMAVSSGRTGEAEAGCSYKAKRPYFILTWTQQKDCQVEIPKAFLRAVEGKLPDVVFLKDHGDVIWPVRLKEADGRVWFQEGWKEFVEYKSINDQQFLVFRFDGKLYFDVSLSYITNKSAYEMKDLNDFKDHNEPSPDKTSQFNEEKRSSENLSETKEASDLNKSTEQQREESSPGEGNVECSDYSSSSTEGSAVAIKQVVSMKKDTKKKNKMSFATRLASEFNSKNPFFAITLQSSLLKHNVLHIPSHFRRTHLPKEQVGRKITLQVSDGQKWSVRCIVGGRKKNGIRLSKGLNIFLSSNKLLAGDVCIFEAIKMNPTIVLKVHIFRCRDMD